MNISTHQFTYQFFINIFGPLNFQFNFPISQGFDFLDSSVNLVEENDNNKDNLSSEKTIPSIIQHISQIPDPRNTTMINFHHPFVSIVFIALVTGLCGADNWVEVEGIAIGLQDWIAEYVPLPNGIPSHDTFGRVFSLIAPEEFNKFLITWSSFLRKKPDGKEIISFDGKALCGSANKALGIKGLHILNAWSQTNGICLGQLKVDDKSNEIVAMPELLKLLDLQNCIVTADALNTQKKIVKEIGLAGADYVLPVKDNHPTLLDEIKKMFDFAIISDFDGCDSSHYKTFDCGHGRIEERIYHVISAENLPNRDEWKNLKNIGMACRKRTIDGKISIEIEYYIMSIEGDAELFERTVRGHWGIENLLHWHLDVTFKEDSNHYRNRIGAQNLAIIRKVNLGMLSKTPLPAKMKKCGLQVRRKIAATNRQYREDLLKNLV